MHALPTIDLHAAGEVHVWLLDPAVADVHATARYCEGLLSPAEQVRWQGMRDPRARRHYALGRALVRTVLARYAPVAPDTWQLDAGPGPLAVRGPRAAPPLAVSLAHTRGLVAAAVSDGAAVGIDVERVDRPVEAMALVRRFWGPALAAELATQPAAVQQAAFLQRWVLLEAVGKALGRGVALPRGALAFAGLPDAPRVRFGAGLDEDPAAWQLALTQPGGTHWLGLALRHGGRPRAAVVRRAELPPRGAGS